MTDQSVVEPSPVDAAGDGSPSRDSPVVSARGLAVSYGRNTVWRSATFDVRPGEFVAVLGPNGAGKSTLIRMLLGLVRPSEGTLRVLGRTPRRGNPAIGYVPQNRAVDAEMRLRGTEFVRLGLTGHRWGPGRPRHSAAVRHQVDAAVAAVGAQDYAAGPIGTMSGGERQRLMLAEALIGNPALLLLDEPLASLDMRNQVGMAGLIAAVARARDLAVLLIAHDVNPLLPVVDRVIYVARGQITIGRPDDVISSERLSDLYQTQVEVLRDSRGRLFVVGLEDEAAHPHDLDPGRPADDTC